MEAIKCLECGSVIRGRTDKKFCNDYCRNSYHNRMKSQVGATVRKINKILRTNYQILRQKVPADTGKITVSLNELLAAGFNLTYHTHIYTTKKGHTYYFCYEYGYMDLGQEKYILVKRKDPV